jgi:hypothetical protein
MALKVGDAEKCSGEGNSGEVDHGEADRKLNVLVVIIILLNLM